MSGKHQVKPLLSKHHLSNENTLILTNSHHYNEYEQELESNLRTILKRYSHLDKEKVRNLLEELENNLEPVIKVLEEEEQACNKILQEKKVEVRKPLNLTQEQENQIFKQSFLKLYKKYMSTLKENEEISKKCECLKQQNERLKYLTKQLMAREYSQSYIHENRDVC